MKFTHEILRGGVNPNKYSRTSHVICLADFDTSHPNPNRINRIANEINEYLKWERKFTGVSK